MAHRDKLAMVGSRTYNVTPAVLGIHSLAEQISTSKRESPLPVAG